jgi:phage terminase large subunit-like protein
MAKQNNVEDIQKYQLYCDIVQLESIDMNHIMNSFVPEDPTAEPSQIQVDLFSSEAKFKVARAGNRSGKTFSTMRDLAWKLMRNHPYRQKWRLSGTWDEAEYTKQGPKIFWIAVPDYEFGHETCWLMYLQKFIPRWFYTKDDGEEMLTYNQNSHLIGIHFRNGDRLQIKTYAQRIEGVMGRKIDHLVTDEMPPSLLRLMEFMTRCADTAGEVVLGFTPLNPDEEIKNYIDDTQMAGGLELYSWSMTQNPHYMKHPELMQDLLDKWKYLPEGQLRARLNGEWYYEAPDGTMFNGVVFPEVEDFDIPISWRRCRVTDPANRVTGHAEFAEDPMTGTWYCYKAYQIGWKAGSIMDAKDILKEVNKNKPAPWFKYYYSLYDNAELWFGAEACKEDHYSPTILKNVEQATMDTRNVIKDGKLKFFKQGAGFVVTQMRMIPNPKAGKARSGKFHASDCVMYFCRQVPLWTAPVGQETTEEQDQKMLRAWHDREMAKSTGDKKYKGTLAKKINTFYKSIRRGRCK